MLKNKKMTVTLALFLAVIFLLPNIAAAQNEYGANDLIDQGVNLVNSGLRESIANIINIVLGFLGVIGIFIVLYGGFIWMTSAGNPEKIVVGIFTVQPCKNYFRYGFRRN